MYSSDYLLSQMRISSVEWFLAASITAIIGQSSFFLNCGRGLNLQHDHSGQSLDEWGLVCACLLETVNVEYLVLT